MTQSMIKDLYASRISTPDVPQFIIRTPFHYAATTTRSGRKYVKFSVKVDHEHIRYQFNGFDLGELYTARDERIIGEKMLKIYQTHPNEFGHWQIDNDGFNLKLIVNLSQRNDEQIAQQVTKFYQYLTGE